MSAINAAAHIPQQTFKLFAAVEPLRRNNQSATKGPYINFDEKNRFTLYQQLSTCNPYVSTSLNKLGLSLVKGMKFDGTSKRNAKEFEDFSKKTNFLNQVQSLARILCRDGTYVALPISGVKGGNFRLTPLLMPALTILPEGVEPGAKVDEIMSPGENIEKMKFCINEGEKFQEVYEFSQVIYGVYNEWDSVQEDRKKRKTYGLYGSSLLVPIIPSIQNLLDLDQGYVNYVKKYGQGRYAINLRALEEAVKQGIITPAQASEAVQAFAEEHKKLSENEDIIGAGLEVLTPDAKGSLDTSKFKESLETEIMLGLFQSPLTMGKASGTTYASSYMVEEDRMLVLEGLQKIVESITNQAINARLRAIGKPEDSVWVAFDELSKPVLDFNTLLEMCNTGKITDEELRQRAGFSTEKPAGTIKE
jgi:hypothetical protein